MRSEDDGDHWTESALAGVVIGQTAMSYVVAVSPTDPNTILYETEGGNPPNGDRLYRSTDGGTKWSVFEGVTLANQAFFDLAVDPLDGSHLLAATNSGIYERKGGTWT